MSHRRRRRTSAVTADSGSAPDADTSVWAWSLVMTTTIASAAVLISALIDLPEPVRAEHPLDAGQRVELLERRLHALGRDADAALRGRRRDADHHQRQRHGQQRRQERRQRLPEQRRRPCAGSGCVRPRRRSAGTALRRSSYALPTSIGSSTLAAAAPAQVPSSWVRGICPSLRAFFRRWGVGFSVFSPPGPSLATSAAPQRDHRPHGLVHQRVQGGRAAAGRSGRA